MTQHRILFPIDLDHDSSWKPVLPVAVELARAREATLHVMTVVPKLKRTPGLPSGADFGENVPSIEEYNRTMREAMEQELGRFIADEVPDDVTVEKVVGVGSVYRQILQVAEDTDANLIVMSGYRPSLQSFLLGTNAERVTRHAGCSVYIVRP
jgi:nucleotide-binding universal stress UspA family protein